MPTRWALKWQSENRLDGKCAFVIWKHGEPLLFHTRKDARRYKKKNYGYISKRKDLRSEPHGWRSPKVVKVDIIIREL